MSVLVGVSAAGVAGGATISSLTGTTSFCCCCSLNDYCILTLHSLSPPYFSVQWETIASDEKLRLWDTSNMTILPKKKSSGPKSDTETGSEHGHGQVGERNQWVCWTGIMWRGHSKWLSSVNKTDDSLLHSIDRVGWGLSCPMWHVELKMMESLNS